jgi:RNA polymerase sigma-70 factor (ECF subfamily)
LSLAPSPGGYLEIGDLYQEYEDKLRGYAMSLARDAHRADDLVQDTFVRAIGHFQLLGQLKPYQRRAWLYRVLKNLFLDEQRAGQRQQTLLDHMAREVQVASQPSVDVVVRELMGMVPERYREVLHRRYILGMTSEEIGRELGIPAATVRSRLYLARKWIRTHQSDLI